MVGCFEDERPVLRGCAVENFEVEQDGVNYLEHSSVENSGPALWLMGSWPKLWREDVVNLSFHYIQAEDLKRSKMFGSFVDEFERVRRIATKCLNSDNPFRV